MRGDMNEVRVFGQLAKARSSRLFPREDPRVWKTFLERLDFASRFWNRIVARLHGEDGKISGALWMTAVSRRALRAVFEITAAARARQIGENAPIESSS